MFDFSRGEWIAASLLFISILGMLLFSQFYTGSSAEEYLFSDFKNAVTQFQERQFVIEDSLKRVKAERFEKNRYGSTPTDSSRNKKEFSFEKKEKKLLYKIVKLELNHCDSTEIIVIPQFGSKRAQKLVEYREKLGGYYDFEQIKEIYIMQNMETDFLKKYFTIDPSLIRKIEINTAPYNELVAHPYFDAYLAKTVIHYRENKGAFSSLKDFQKATHAYQELLDKLEPYLIFEVVAP